MDVTGVSIRAAEPDEAEALSALALRAKAHHGYDEEFLRAVAGELRVSRDLIAEGSVFLVDDRGSIAGFYALTVEPPVGELAFLFIEPAATGKGYGRLLWNHAIAEARALGCEEVRVVADPYAERFYLALGCERIGEVASASIADRALPVLRARV